MLSRTLLRWTTIVGLFAAATVAHGTTLRVGLYGIPKTLGNPYSSTSISEHYTWSAIFDALTEVDGQGRVKPALALSWQAVDSLTWRFELRRGVKFHNGAVFDAKAVVAAVDYLTSPEAASESMARELSALAGARQIDAHTVEITTDTPTLILPGMLAAMRIVEPESWSRLGPKGFAQAPIGTGAFKLKAWSPAKVSLAAFQEGWRPPQVEALELFEILDPAGRLQGVQSGKLDIAIALTPDDIDFLEHTGGKAYVGPGSGVVGMSFITVKEGPIADKRVRQALNYAVNKEAITRVLLGGHSRPAGQPAPHYAHGHDASIAPYPYDPEKAKALLAEAGYPNGFSMIAEVVMSGTTNAANNYGFVIEQLADIGVDLEVRAIPISQLIIKAVTGSFNGTGFGMEFDLKPSLDLMRAIPMHSCQRAVPWHCDETIMPVIEAAQREFDPDKRLGLLHQIARHYHDNPPMLYFFESIHFDGLAGGVNGYAPQNRIINYHEISVVR